MSTVPAIVLASGAPTRVPALLSFLRWRPPEGEVLFVRPDATGLAVHASDAAAIRNATLEVFERDMAVRSWRLPDHPVSKLDIARINDLTAVLERAKLRAHAYCVSVAKCPPVVVAMCENPVNEAFTVGSGAAFSIEDAASKAVAEAMSNLTTPTTMAARVSSSLGRAQWARCHRDEILAWYDAWRGDCIQDWSGAGDEELKRCAAQRYTGAVAVDLTDHKREPHWRCWRVIAPGGARPSTEDDEPHVFGGRKDLNLKPFPFS